ncbi:MAG: MoaD/ThiS family protein [Bacteroidota bacterium]
MEVGIGIMAFGIARDIVQGNQVFLPWEEGLTVGRVKAMLEAQYPGFKALKTFAIAVNEEYATDDHIIGQRDEVVIIPPVSGG